MRNVSPVGETAGLPWKEVYLLHKCVVVEFTGISGSGKTCLMNTVGEELRSRGIDASDPSYMKHKAVFALLNIPLLVKSCWWILRTGSQCFRGSFNVCMKWFKVQLRIKYFGNITGIHLIDEGLVHRLRMIRRCSKKQINLKHISDAGLFFSDRLVIVEADKETVAKRKKDRDGKVLTASQLEASVESMKHTRDDAEYLKRTLADFDYILVPNSDGADIRLEAQKVVNFILHAARG